LTPNDCATIELLLRRSVQRSVVLLSFLFHAKNAKEQSSQRCVAWFVATVAGNWWVELMQ